MVPALVMHSSLSLVERAIVFASLAHQGQLDKGEQPYILHPLRVMDTLYPMSNTVGFGQELLATAVLHDVIEDCGVSHEYLIEAGFPVFVADKVLNVSRRPGVSRADYISGIANSGTIEYSVKIADMLDNSSPGRLHFLKSETQDRLLAKYHNDFKVLLSSAVCQLNGYSLLRSLTHQLAKQLGVKFDIPR